MQVTGLVLIDPPPPKKRQLVRLTSANRDSCQMVPLDELRLAEWHSVLDIVLGAATLVLVQSIHTADRH